MAFALARTRALLGLEAPLVSVEVHLSGGLPRTSLVGLPAAAVRESKDRVRAALVASDFQYPNGRVVINLGPADLPKEGGRFDLPIALGILAASGQLPAERLAEVEVVGELSPERGRAARTGRRFRARSRPANPPGASSCPPATPGKPPLRAR